MVAQEDEIDDEVRRDLDGWAADGRTGISFLGLGRAASLRGHARRGADRARATSSTTGSTPFGTYEDAVLADDPWMAHSLVSAPLNLGLLDPLDVVRQAEERHRSDGARLASVEGFVRQVMGWRDYVWHLYWHLGEDYRRRNGLSARRTLPDWFAELDGDARRGGLPLAHARRRRPARLGPPHPAADDPRQLRPAARLEAAARSPTGSTARSSTATTG